MKHEQRTQSGLSLKTLLIAGAASATAAFLVPMLWRPGTVFAAAMTPVIVTLATELLRRPVDTVSAVATRRTPTVLDSDDEPFDPLSPPSAEELEALPRSTAPTSALHHRKPLTARQWKLALVTGLVAFAGVATLFTASELLAGDAVNSATGRTTFFGGGKSDKADATPTPEATPSATPEKSEQEEDPEATPTPTPTATPTPVPTATPTATPTPLAAPEATPPADATPVP